MPWSNDPGSPFWFDQAAEQRFHDERTARKGAQLLDHDPDDDFGDLPEVKVLDPWQLAS